MILDSSTMDEDLQSMAAEDSEIDPVSSSPTLRSFMKSVSFAYTWSTDLFEKRKVSHWLVDNPYFTILVSMAIVANTVQIGLSADFREDDLKSLWNIMDILFTISSQSNWPSKESLCVARVP